MGAGGATWLIAGALGVGSGNAMDLADTSEVGAARPYNHAWWVYTPTEDGVLTLDTFATTGGDLDVVDTLIWVYDQDDEPVDLHDYIAHNDDAVGHPGLLSLLELDVIGGTTYHVLVGSFDSDGDTIETYRLNAALMTWVTSPWIDDLQDDPNYVIVTDGDLLSDNLPPYATPPSWFNHVLRFGPTREGDYEIQQVFTGDSVVAGADCAMEHGLTGDRTFQYWNNDPDSITWVPPPTCRVLPTGDAAYGVGTATVSWSLGYLPPSPPLIGDIITGQSHFPSYGAWFMVARDNLGPLGALDMPDPTDYGFPFDAEIEIEDAEVTLVKIEVADGDTVGSTSEYPNRWAINDPIGPDWDSGLGWFTPWQFGTPTGGDLQFDYSTGTPAWHEIPDSDGWEGHGWEENYPTFPEDAGSGAPDIIGVAWAEPATGVDTSGGRFGHLAVKFTLQASRFRFRYLGEVLTPDSVVRQHPRDDEKGWGSGTRLYPPTKANRTIGGIQ